MQAATGFRAFDFAVEGARAEDYLVLYRWVRARGIRPRVVVIGLDVEALHDDDRPEPRYAVGFFITYLFLNETPTVFLYYQF